MFLWGFHDGGFGVEPGVGKEVAEAFQADGAPAQVGVAVPAGA
jgi:hypothetical protein